MNKPSSFTVEWGTRYGSPLEYRYARGRILDPEGRPIGIIEIFDFGFLLLPTARLTYRTGKTVRKEEFELPREADPLDCLRSIWTED